MTLLLTLPSIISPILEAPFYYTWAWDTFLNFIGYVYFIVMHANYGQTLGKMAMGIKVVQVKDESPIGFFEALKRDIVPVLFLLFAFFSNMMYYTMNITFTRIGPIDYINNIYTLWILAEFITMLTNEKRRAVHDYIAKTVVIRTR